MSETVAGTKWWLRTPDITTVLGWQRIRWCCASWTLQQWVCEWR